MRCVLHVSSRFALLPSAARICVQKYMCEACALPTAQCGVQCAVVQCPAVGVQGVSEVCLTVHVLYGLLQGLVFNARPEEHTESVRASLAV